jgi:hypothetical protein
MAVVMLTVLFFVTYFGQEANAPDYSNPLCRGVSEPGAGSRSISEQCIIHWVDPNHGEED